MRLELRRLSADGVDGALAMADHYRDLNQPDEAESICRDVLDIAPRHQGALRTLGLALTDRFGRGWHRAFDEAVACFALLESEYDRVYFTGIAWERCAKAQLEADEAKNARNSFERALEQFDRAGEISAGASPDPVLRWNRCVRALTTHPDLAALQQPPDPKTFQYDELTRLARGPVPR